MNRDIESTLPTLHMNHKGNGDCQREVVVEPEEGTTASIVIDTKAIQAWAPNWIRINGKLVLPVPFEINDGMKVQINQNHKQCCCITSEIHCCRCCLGHTYMGGRIDLPPLHFNKLEKHENNLRHTQQKQDNDIYDSLHNRRDHDVTGHNTAISRQPYSSTQGASQSNFGSFTSNTSFPFPMHMKKDYTKRITKITSDASTSPNHNLSNSYQSTKKQQQFKVDLHGGDVDALKCNESNRKISHLTFQSTLFKKFNQQQLQQPNRHHNRRQGERLGKKGSDKNFEPNIIYRLHVLLFELSGLDGFSKRQEQQKVIQETGLNKQQIISWLLRHSHELAEHIQLFKHLVEKKIIDKNYKSFVTYCRLHRIMPELPSDNEEDGIVVKTD